MICSNCGNKISDDSKFCYKCGNKTTSKNNKLKPTQKLCNRCGSEISSDAVFCYKCGNNTGSIDSNETTGSTTENHNVQIEDVLKVENTNQSTEEEFNSSNVNAETNKKGSNTKLIWISAVAVFMIVLGIASTNDNTNTSADTNTNEIQSTKTYTNKEIGISFKYPEDWTKGEDLPYRDSFILSLSAKIEENNFVGMYIDMMNTPYEGFTITDMVSTFSNEETQSGYTIRDVENIKIDGVDAVKASFDSKDGNTLIEYAYVQNGNLYIITFSSPAYYLNIYEPIFDSIMESYTIMYPIKSTTQKQNTEDYGLSEEEALEVAQQFIDTHPLYERTVTGVVEYEPEDYDYDYSTKGLYKIKLLNNDGEDRFMWVDKKTGSVLHSLDGVNLVTGEEFYNAMFVSAQNRDEIYFNEIKISDYLGSSVDDIYDDFGPPIRGTDVDGKTYTTGSYMGYNSIDFIYDEDIEYIEYIVGKPKMFTYKGVTLDKSRDELVELLGTPSYETPVNNDTEKPDNTILEFSMISYTLRFDFKSGYNDTYKIALYYE